MKVRELIELLSKKDPEMQVLVYADDGDSVDPGAVLTAGVHVGEAVVHGPEEAPEPQECYAHPSPMGHEVLEIINRGGCIICRMSDAVGRPTRRVVVVW